MTEKTRTSVTMTLDGGTFEVTTWTRFSLRQSYSDPRGSFRFTVAAQGDKRDQLLARIRKGERCEIWIDGNLQATALIETVSRKVMVQGGVMIDATARSPLTTPYKGSIDPYFAQQFQADTPLRDVVLKALEPYGFDEIDVDTTADVTAISGKSLTGRADPVVLSELKHKDIKATFRESAYQFCARLFNRYGLLLRCSREGKLLLGSPDYQQASSYTCVQDADRAHRGNRFVGDIEEVESNEGTFSEILVFGQNASRAGLRSASPPIGGVIVDGVTRPAEAYFPDVKLDTIPFGPHSYRSTAAPYKPRIHQEKRNRDPVQCSAHARTMLSFRSEQAYMIRGTVSGLVSVEGRVWAVDTVGRVIVDALGIDDELWLLETEAVMDANGGQQTRLTWVPKNSLVLGVS